MNTPNFFSIAYYGFVSLLIIIVLIDSYREKHLMISNGESKYFYLIPIFLVALIGFRPVGPDGFIDSALYQDLFHSAELFGTSPMIHKDVIFGYYVLIISYFTNERGFFIVSGLISILLLVLTSRKVSEKYWILFFICHLASIYYWNYNVYGIRQGLATAIFLYALFVGNKWIKILLMTIALGMHFSLLLPVTVYILVFFINRVYKIFYAIWVLAIPVSYFFGTKIEHLVSKIIPDKRIDYFILNLDRKGFRLDMIIYSFAFIAVSYYFIFIKKIKDKTYHKIVNLFIITNTVFLLLIRANHTHRFAYLSWFLTSLVVFYPFFISEGEELKKKYNLFSQILAVFFTFVIFHFIRITFF